MSGFVKRNKSINPAGGINPAVQPNVGQYGWTSFDAANVNQLIDYVKAAREAAESAQTDAAYIKTQLVNIDNTVLYFERLYNEIKPVAENIEKIYLEIIRIRDKMDIQVADVQKMHDAILVMFAEVQTILNEMRSLRDETKVYKDSAKQSEVASVEAMQKSIDIYEELKKGQVYRGTWNPNTAKYPDNGNTNSVWDVVLNAGQDKVAFDGKDWFFGDRLIYVKDTNKYEQLEAGTNVKSVNGKTGSVVLEAADVKALPISGGTLTGGLNINGSIHSTGSTSIRVSDANNINLRMVPSSGYGYFQAGHSTDDTNQKMLLSGMNGKGLTEFQIRMASNAQPQVRLGSNNYNIYHTGNKPTASDVGGVARGGDTMSGALTVPSSRGLRTGTQSDGTYAAISAEGNHAMLWKFNQSTTVADEFIGITGSTLKFRQDLGTGNKAARDHKVYHEGFKPTAADIGAMGSNGGTITGDMILNEKLTVKKDFIIDTGQGYRMATKNLGTTENNKASLVLFCPVASATAQNSQGFSGRINIFRGASNAYNLVSWIDLTARVAYTELAATIHDQYSNRATSDTMKLVQTKHNGVDWLALFLPSTSTRVVTMDGVVTGNDPIFVASSDGYTTIDFSTMSEVVRHNRQTRALDVVDTSSTGGYKFNTKVAIGGTNDTWLRLNPSNHFSSGIYSSTGTIRHDGGDIQLKNWGTGNAKPVRVAVPASDQYVTSNPGQAVVNVKVPASANATRLFNVYDDTGKMKSSIVSRDDTAGSLSFITDGGTDAKNRVAMYGGQVYAMGDQVANDNALTKVSYTEGRYLKKTTDTMSGTLTATDVNARLTHNLGYMVIKPYGSTYDDGTFIRGYYRGHDSGKPGTGWAGIKWDKFTPAAGDVPSKSEGFDMQLGNNFVYHQGRKPTSTDVGAMSDESTHVATSVDLNTYTKNGTYNLYGPSSVTLTNAPAGFQYGTLLVVGRGAVTHSFVTQTLTNKNNNMQWVRSRTDGAFGWSAWSAIFSEANPPKMDQIDAVLRTGDTMTGDLTMDNSRAIRMRGTGASNPILWFLDKDDGNKNKIAVFHDRANDRLGINHYDSATGKYAAFRFKQGQKSPTYAPDAAGGSFHLYHEGFKPSASDVGAPVLDSATKAVVLQSPDAGIDGGTIRTVRDDSAQVTWMTDRPLSGTNKAIGIHSVRGPVFNDGQTHEIYHTGRKPTAADISGVLTQGAWGIGDYPGFVDAAEGQNYTEDKTRDFNKLITTGTYSLSGNWLNSINNLGTEQSVTATIQVIARKWGAGPTVYQKFIMGQSTDGTRYAERTGTGTYPDITWSRWRENGTYQVNTEYRMTIERPGTSAYPYMTLHKKDDRTDLTSGYYAIGAMQFKHSTMSDINNPDSGKLAAQIQANTAWDRSNNQLFLGVRKASDGTIANSVVLEEGRTVMAKDLSVVGEVKNKGSNGFRMSDGQVGTFWRKDSDNLYLMKTASGEAENGTWTADRPLSMNLTTAKVTIGNGLTVKGGQEIEGGPLRLSTNYLIGANDQIFMRDHGNGNVTLSAGKNSSGTAGDLYLGYNAAASGTGGYATRNVRIDSPLINKTNDVLINGSGYINGDFIRDGAVQTLVDDNAVRHTIIGGNDTINRGRTIVAAGEAGKAIADNTSTGAEDLYLAADGTVFIETAVQNGFGSRKTIKMNAGEIYAQDGTKRVYHEGFKPSAADLNVAPGGFGLGGAGARCPGEDCNQAVANGFYAIYSGTINTPETTGPSGSKMFVVAWSNQHVSQTFYRVTENRSWTRSSKLVSGVVEWSPWAEVYTTARKPTASDVQALPLTGGNLAGGLNIVSDSGLIVRKTNGTHAFRTVESGGFIYLQGGNTDGEQREDQNVVVSGYQGRGLSAMNFLMKDVNTHPAVRVGSTNYPIYHAGNKPSVGDISGALATTGGTMTGDLKISGSRKLILPTTTYATGAQIWAQDADQYGANLIVSSGGATVIGSGESGQAASTALADKTLPAGEKMYITSDDTISFISGANAWADRKETLIGKDGKFTTANDISINDTTRGKNFTMGTGNSDTWLVNSKSNKYFQMKDDGTLQYDSKHIYYKGNPATAGGMIGESKILGATEDLDNYKTAGVYHQPGNAGATTGANYPEKLAGSLVIYAAAGVVQEYRIYNTSRMWRRAQYSSGAWTEWSRDYNSLNKPTAVDVGALSLSAGGTVAGQTVHTGLTAFVGGMAKFYNGASTHHNIQSVGNNLHFSTGNNGDTLRMAIMASGEVQMTNNLVVDNGRILNQRTVNPMLELHAPGLSASMMYVNSAGNLVLSQSNGGGTDVGNYITMNTQRMVVKGQVANTWGPGRSWTETTKGAFCNDATSYTAGPGVLHCAVSQTSTVPNQYQNELILGTLFGNDYAQGRITLTSMNHSTGGRASWFFGHNGLLESPTGYRIDGTGNITGNAFGGGTLTAWAIRSFAPASDGNLKKVLGESKTSALDEVSKMKFHSYTWTGEGASEDLIKRDAKVTDIGFIAQELEELNPNYTRDVQTYNEDLSVKESVKTVDTANLLAVALKAIQEQSEQIATLQAEVAQLKKRRK